MKKIYMLKECTDPDICYGYLTCEGVFMDKDIQTKISVIKGSFGDDEWTINDMIKKLPKEWNAEFHMFTGNLYI